MIVCGIDPAMGNTAIVYGSSLKDFQVKAVSTSPLGKEVANRLARYDTIVHAVDSFLSTIHPGVVMLEHYSFGSRNGGEYLGELGGLLRWHLIDHTPNLIEVPPGTLKKFVAEKGNAKKDIVAAKIARRWGVELDSGDEYDAFGLYVMGLCAAGLHEPETNNQSEVIAKIMGDRRIIVTGEEPGTAGDPGTDPPPF